MQRPQEFAPATKPCPSSHAGQRVLVFGLGRFGGGVGVTRWLAGQGAHVTVTDRAGAESLGESIEALAGLDLTLHLGGHDDVDLTATDLVIVNPAVRKLTSGFFRELAARGIPWTTEMNLFCERCPAPVIGVTGTFGKSTTCAMLAAALDECRRAGDARYSAVHLGGNIGRSLLPDLGSIQPNDLVVLEMSNAQLEDLPRISWAPRVAVITNLTPHHIDRYGSARAYVLAKLNIVRDPAAASAVIVGPMYAEARSMLLDLLAESPGRLVPVVQPDPPAELLVPGLHNQENAACVLAVCRHLGLDDALVRGALRSFRGLPHRLEFVRSLDGVDYVNDSKSTAPAAIVTAVEALTEGTSPGNGVRSGDHPPRAGAGPSLVAIVGGQHKDVSLDACADSLVRHCRAVVCTGESGPSFAEAIRAVAADHLGVATIEVERLENAVRRARAEASTGDTVLFSPGAPSFDRYSNYAERGQCFVDAVTGL